MPRLQSHAILKAKTINGLSLLLIREGILKIIAIFGQFILIRFLLPEYFGVLAVITFLLGVADLFSDFGFSLSIIQSKSKPSNLTLSTIVHVKLVFISLAVLGSFLATPYIFHLYPSLTPPYVTAFHVMVLTLLLRPLHSIYVALLERDLSYSIISTIDVLGVVVYYISALICLYLNLGVWCLVVPVLLKDSFELILLYRQTRWLPSFKFRFSSIQSHLRFSVWIQFSTIIGFFNNSIVSLLGGLRASAYQVGLLDWSQNLASLPRTLTDNVGRVAFAAFSRLQDQKALLSKSMDICLNALSLFTLLFIVLFLSLGKPFIHFLATDAWSPALPSLQWFMVGTFFVAGYAVLQKGIIALGKAREVLFLSTTIIFLQWLLAYWLLGLYGFVGIPIATTLGSAFLFISYALYAHYLEIPIRLLPLLTKVTLSFIVLILSLTLRSLLNQSFLSFLFCGLFTTALYVILVSIFSRRELVYLFSLIHNSLLPQKAKK